MLAHKYPLVGSTRRWYQWTARYDFLLVLYSDIRSRCNRCRAVKLNRLIRQQQEAEHGEEEQHHEVSIDPLSMDATRLKISRYLTSDVTVHPLIAPETVGCPNSKNFFLYTCIIGLTKSIRRFCGSDQRK